MKKKPTVIDLFCGCGGFSQGFLDAGFEVLAANEFWDPAIETYKFNHKSVNLIEGDITQKEIKERLSDSINGEKVNVIIGGPPCQGYSQAGNRNPDDPRGQLYLDFFEIIDKFRPDFFVMENVKGLKNMKHVDPNLSETEKERFKENCDLLQRFKDLKRYGAQRDLEVGEQEEYDNIKNDLKTIKKQINSKLVPLINKIQEKITEIGYKATWKVLNSANYGVAQTRERIIFIGTKHQDIDIYFPEKTHSNNNSEKNSMKKWLTVKDVLKKYENWNENQELSHIFTKHSQSFVKKIENTEIGENIYKNYSDAWWRLNPERPARTVKENHGGVFLHYKYPRACTPRELAMLQSFEDSYIFKGTKSSVLKQIGNAVPPLMSKNIAEKIKILLKNIN